MSSGQAFDLHPEPARDILEMREFIAEDNPHAAGRVREDILDAIRNLVSYPHIGYRGPDLTSQPVRFKRVRDCLVSNAPGGAIVAILRGREQPRPLT